jgi:hypothetical protein
MLRKMTGARGHPHRAEKFSVRLFSERSPRHSELCCACGDHHAKKAAARVIEGFCTGVTGDQTSLDSRCVSNAFYDKTPLKSYVHVDSAKK